MRDRQRVDPGFEEVKGGAVPNAVRVEFLARQERVTHLAYDGAGHGIYAPYGPTTMSTSLMHPVDGKRYALGGSARGNADAVADSWPKVLAFLEQARAGRDSQASRLPALSSTRAIWRKRRCAPASSPGSGRGKGSGDGPAATWRG